MAITQAKIGRLIKNLLIADAP